MAAQNQPPPPPSPSPRIILPQQTIVISEVQDAHVSVVLVVSTIQHRMPPIFPWGMLGNFMPEGYNPAAQVTSLAQHVVVSAPPVVHATPVFNKEFENPLPPLSESLDFYD